MPRLRVLKLSLCRNMDATPLARFSATLEELSLNCITGMNLATLPDAMPRLRVLKLASCSITDATPLARFSATLEKLNLSHNRIDLATLPDAMPRLRVLNLRECGIATPLARFSHIADI